MSAPALSAEALGELLRMESRVHRPPHGTPREWLEATLAPTFWEVAASGRRYDRATFLGLVLECAAQPHDDRWAPIDVDVQPLAADLWLLTYSMWQGPRLSRRASLWRQTPQGWQTLYHQGTVVMAQFMPDRADH